MRAIRKATATSPIPALINHHFRINLMLMAYSLQIRLADSAIHRIVDPHLPSLSEVLTETARDLRPSSGFFRRYPQRGSSK